MQLNCLYIFHPDGYNCRAKNVVITELNQTVTSENGTHDGDHKNVDVKIFYVHTEEQFKHLPVGLNHIFLNLNKLNVEYTPLKIINKSDFIGLTGIKTIHFTDNLIENFPGDTFSTLVELEYISLQNNSIEILASNTFANLRNLVEVYFQHNKIQYLDSVLFQNNDKLERIIFNRNKLLNIGSALIKNWNLIKSVDLNKNICINNNYTSNLADRESFKHDVTNCTTPMVMLPLESYQKLKKVEIEFEDYKKNEKTKEVEPEPHDGSIVNKIEVVGYFFKTVLDHKQIVYTSVFFNLILIVVIIIRCRRKNNVTQIVDTTLILQRKHTITSRNSLI